MSSEPGIAATEPVEEQLAEHLAQVGRAPRTRDVLHRLGAYDLALYRSVARLPPSVLDRPLRNLSQAANYSRPWFAVAALTATVGGPAGRRAAVAGIGAIAVASFVVNQPMKMLGARDRPDRVAAGVPPQRWVPMPSSSSFPSGHSASAAAFAVAVGTHDRRFAPLLGVAAATVAFTRVFTGVHYPGDVVVGVAVGTVAGWAASAVTSAVWRRRG